MKKTLRHVVLSTIRVAFIAGIAFSPIFYSCTKQKQEIPNGTYTLQYDKEMYLQHMLENSEDNIIFMNQSSNILPDKLIIQNNTMIISTESGEQDTLPYQQQKGMLIVNTTDTLPLSMNEKGQYVLEINKTSIVLCKQ